MYDKKLSANQMSTILNISKVEATKLLEHLFQIGVISKTIIDKVDCYFLLQPKICDSIMMLKDALYNIKFANK
jgi:predicted transcriptional regulator